MQGSHLLIVYVVLNFEKLSCNWASPVIYDKCVEAMELSQWEIVEDLIISAGAYLNTGKSLASTLLEPYSWKVLISQSNLPVRPLSDLAISDHSAKALQTGKLLIM